MGLLVGLRIENLAAEEHCNNGQTKGERRPVAEYARRCRLTLNPTTSRGAFVAPCRPLGRRLGGSRLPPNWLSGHLEYFAVIERDGRSRFNSILRVVPRPFKISGTDQARCVVTQSNSRRAPSAANVRFGSKADLRPSHQECPLSGAKQTLFSTTLGSSIIRPFSLRKEKDHVHLREKDQ